MTHTRTPINDQDSEDVLWLDDVAQDEMPRFTAKRKKQWQSTYPREKQKGQS